MTESAYAAAGKSAQEQLVLDAVFAHGGSCPLVDLERLFENVSPARALQSLVRKGVLETDSREKRRVGDKKIRMVSLTVSAEDAQVAADRREKRAPLQSACLRLLCTLDRVSFSELCYFTGASSSSVNALVKAGLAEITQDEVFRRSVLRSEEQSPLPELNEEQRAAFEGILSLYDGEHASASLLYGVTGSGKTSVYVHLIDAMRRKGKASILLVPEIALTPQMIRIFSSYFGDDIAVLHSSLAVGERYDEWKRIKTGRARVVIGTRSAVFAPCSDLGLIIMDEEQEYTYKSENSPRYHARDAAKFRCASSNALLVLGSATPSVESYYKAEKGEYKLLELPHRINNLLLPEMEVVDMSRELRAGNRDVFSTSLKDALRKTIAAKEQAIIFLNRRGFASFVMCKDCGFILKCKDCDVSLTYHKEDNQLKCHYCGKRYEMIDRCPICHGTNIRQGRIGTERVVEEVRKVLPEARVLRMDNDTTSEKGAHQRILSAFSKGEADVLVGTQMIAKGHDFQNVTLVGILDADFSLYLSDYRSNERTFQLITQVAGRAGRAGKSGKVIIQTYTPRHYVFRYAASYDYKNFYLKEKNTREVTKFPPFTNIVRILITSTSDRKAMDAAKNINEKMKVLLEEFKPDFIYYKGSKAPVTRIQNRYRYQLLMRIKPQNFETVKQRIFEITDAYRGKDGLWVFVEINPQSLV